MAFLAVAIVATGVAVALGASNTEQPVAKPRGTAATSSEHCSRFEPAHVSSSPAGATVDLAPANATQVVLCRYDGPFGARQPPALASRFRLVATLTLGGTQARHLAGELNDLPVMPFRCSATPGPAVVMFFTDPSGQRDSVKVNLTDCGTATNGHVVRSANVNGEPFLNELEARIHAPSASARKLGGRHATIAGYLWLCGGPAPGRCFRSTVGSCSPTQGCSRTDRVVAIATTGLVVAQQRLRFPWPDGRFRLLVPPGDYAVELLADGSRVHNSLVQTIGATARADRTAKIIFAFNVP